jgi:hypothetical protein
MDILRDFWTSTDDKRRAFAPQVVENQKIGLRVRVYVKMYPYFDLSTGQTIDRPYLRLEALPPDNEHIGLGAIKCRAVCAIEEHLTLWLLKQKLRSLEDRVTPLSRNQEASG